MDIPIWNLYKIAIFFSYKNTSLYFFSIVHFYVKK
nr:MAG TPA: hypothetical protein [Caudoviricetes sp.]